MAVDNYNYLQYIHLWLLYKKEANRIYNTLVADSNSIKPSSQVPENKEVTNLKENGGTSENQELVSGLFFESENDPDLKLILQRWPELPEHIKAAIKALVQTHKTEKK